MKTMIRILHIDDNIHDRQLVKDALQKEQNGFEIVEADNREDFEKYLARGDYDLILSDFNILGFDGLQVLQFVKEKCPDVPVIIVTGTGSEEIAIQAMKMGAADYVIKSVKHIQGLAPTIKKVLENKKVLVERKIALETLRESEDMYRSVYNNSSIAILLTTPDGSILSANNCACKLFDRTNEEICQVGRNELVDISDPRLSILLDERRKNDRASGELTFIKKDGTKFQGEVSSVIFLNREGKEQTSMIIRDLTEQKDAEETIRQERILLRTLIDNLPDAIYVKDSNGRKLIANSADLQIMNCASEAEIIGKTDLDIYDSITGMRGYSEDMKVMQTGQQILNQEDNYFDKNGEEHWRLINKIPLFGENNQIVGLVGFGHEITERKKFEEQLIYAKDKAEEGDRLKTAFLHNISHEIRTPMNAIVGFSELLNSEDLSTDKRQFYTNTIVQSSNRLLSIIIDIISIATIEAGQDTIKEEITNLNSLLDYIYNQFITIAQKQNLIFNLQKNLPDKDANILTDEAKLVKILSNLLGNALKFTKEGQIKYGYRVENSFVQFQVEDTGIGIPANMHEEIFKRFRQIDFSPERHYGGSGLGLSISQAYINQLGGKIWLESEPAKGTTFYFTIPFKKATLQTKQDVHDAISNLIPDTLSRTILIAEDEENNFLYIQELLSGRNYKIIWAVNGLQAVEFCNERADIDLILMDIKMPVMDGFEATKKIKEFRPDLPVIAQTAFVEKNDIDRATSCGCNGFISKPFNEEQLISIINDQFKKQIAYSKR